MFQARPGAYSNVTVRAAPHRNGAITLLHLKYNDLAILILLCWEMSTFLTDMRPDAISAPHEPVILDGRMGCPVPSLPPRLSPQALRTRLPALPVDTETGRQALGQR